MSQSALNWIVVIRMPSNSECKKRTNTRIQSTKQKQNELDWMSELQDLNERTSRSSQRANFKNWIVERTRIEYNAFHSIDIITNAPDAPKFLHCMEYLPFEIHNQCVKNYCLPNNLSTLFELGHIWCVSFSK